MLKKQTIKPSGFNFDLQLTPSDTPKTNGFNALNQAF